jgi:hypothetical protein
MPVLGWGQLARYPLGPAVAHMARYCVPLWVGQLPPFASPPTLADADRRHPLSGHEQQRYRMGKNGNCPIRSPGPFAPTTPGILLLYPGESLKNQIGLWTTRHSEWQLTISFEQSLPVIRKLLRDAGAAIVDTTEDPSQATNAFLQAVARLGANAVTMYTEMMHEGLELFVRVRGSLFVLGPMFDEQWDELFDRLWQMRKTTPISPQHSWQDAGKRRIALPL